MLFRSGVIGHTRHDSIGDISNCLTFTKFLVVCNDDSAIILDVGMLVDFSNISLWILVALSKVGAV